MTLTGYYFINGLLSLLTVSTCFLVGLIMILKYFQYRKKELFYIGFAWMGIYQPWWPSAFVFLLNIFGVVNGGIDLGIYILIGTMFLPFTAFAWFFGVTEMLLKEKKKLIVGIYVAITVLMDILIASLVFTGNSDTLGTIDIIDADYGIILIVYYLFMDVSVATTGILMGRKSLQSEIPQIRLKGKFLIAAPVCYILGGLLDVGLINFIPELIILTRSILMLGSLLFYLGFLLPRPIEELFLKK